MSRVSRGKGLAYFFLLVVTLSACAQAPRASDHDPDIVLPDDRPLRATAPVDMLRCTDRATIPALDNGHLYVNLDGTIAGTIDASSPEVRWSGDDLYFWYEDEIRVWHDGVAETVARVDPDLIPRYPRDDSYFSADAKRFTVTRYHL